jgi:RNA polymerase sigma-70 factor (ECF subfamily)
MEQRELDRIYQRLLVLRCQTGDAAAFEELVAAYSPRLRVYLRQMLAPDAHAADDALQDVWFDCFRQVGKLNDAAAFPAWLYRVARDRAYRLLRRRGVRVAQSIDAAADVVAAGAETEDADDVRDAVHASLDRLPHEQREVLLLRFVEDLSYEQIAAAVGCNVGTVRSRIHYAKRALRDLIGKEPP